MTIEKNELIAIAALCQHMSGDCKSLYDEDGLNAVGMTANQMATFLSFNSGLINKVED